MKRRITLFLVGVLALGLVGILVFSMTRGDDALSSSHVDSQNSASSVAEVETKAAEEKEPKQEKEQREEEMEDLAHAQTGVGYASLNEERQRLYLRFLKGINGLKKHFRVRESNMENLKPTFNAVMMDHPEFFWLSGSNVYSYDSNKGM